MDGATLALFLLTTFIGGTVAGLAGFAMGLVVSGVWLHILTPAETAMLIVGYGLVTQSYNIWRMRHALRWRAVMPFLIGGLFGVPIGTLLLTRIDPDWIRTGVGVLLIVYSSYFLVRPHVTPMQAGFGTETVVGFINGILGGMTGLAGPVITMWCQLRGFAKDKQRAIYQPVILAAFAMTAVSLTAAGAVPSSLFQTYVYGLVPLAAGLWTGLKLYGRLNEATFRRVVLVLLLISGVALIAPLR